jgi:hypothetical protein
LSNNSTKHFREKKRKGKKTEDFVKGESKSESDDEDEEIYNTKLRAEELKFLDYREVMAL